MADTSARTVKGEDATTSRQVDTDATQPALPGGIASERFFHALCAAVSSAMDTGRDSIHPNVVHYPNLVEVWVHPDDYHKHVATGEDDVQRAMNSEIAQRRGQFGYPSELQVDWRIKVADDAAVCVDIGAPVAVARRPGYDQQESVTDIASRSPRDAAPETAPQAAKKAAESIDRSFASRAPLVSLTWVDARGQRRARMREGEVFGRSAPGASATVQADPGYPASFAALKVVSRTALQVGLSPQNGEVEIRNLGVVPLDVVGSALTGTLQPGGGLAVDGQLHLRWPPPSPEAAPFEVVLEVVARRAGVLVVRSDDGREQRVALLGDKATAHTDPDVTGGKTYDLTIDFRSGANSDDVVIVSTPIDAPGLTLAGRPLVGGSPQLWDISTQPEIRGAGFSIRVERSD